MPRKAASNDIEALRKVLSLLEGLPNEMAEQFQDLRLKTSSYLRSIQGPLRLCISGEFSSGKSTLVNILVGVEVAEANVLASDLPPLVYGYAETHTVTAGKWNDPPNAVGPKVTLDAGIDPEFDFIRVGTPSDILRGLEIVDMPGSNDPARDEKMLSAIAAHTDALIWCTNAVNAWRESEKVTWSALPDELRDNGILVVTHVDLKAVRKSLARVMSRVEQETGAFFTEITTFAAPKARSAAPHGNIEDATLWAESGADALIDGIDRLKREKQSEANDSLSDYVATRITPLLQDETSPIYTLRPSLSEAILAWRRRMLSIDQQLDSFDNQTFVDFAHTALISLANDLGALGVKKTEVRWAATQAGAAADLLTSDPKNETAALISQQIDTELDWLQSRHEVTPS